MKLGAIVTAVGVLVGFFFTYSSLRATTVQNEATRRVAITDQFNKAVAALDSTGINARIGGIFSLEQLSISSPEVRDAVMQVLGSFTKARAHVDKHSQCDAESPTPNDIAEALTVIGRRKFELAQPIELSQVCLPSVELPDSNMKDIDFIDADLSYANFSGANLTGDDLAGVTLHKALFAEAKLNSIYLNDSTSDYAIFSDADLTNACITETNRDCCKIR